MNTCIKVIQRFFFFYIKKDSTTYLYILWKNFVGRFQDTQLSADGAIAKESSSDGDSFIYYNTCHM